MFNTLGRFFRWLFGWDDPAPLYDEADDEQPTTPRNYAFTVTKRSTRWPERAPVRPSNYEPPRRSNDDDFVASTLVSEMLSESLSAGPDYSTPDTFSGDGGDFGGGGASGDFSDSSSSCDTSTDTGSCDMGGGGDGS